MEKTMKELELMMWSMNEDYNEFFNEPSDENFNKFKDALASVRIVVEKLEEEM